MISHALRCQNLAATWTSAVLFLIGLSGFGQVAPAERSKPNARSSQSVTSQENRSADILSVLSFRGVDPTGASDSTAGIQNAINDAIATGRELYIPAGVYLCNTASHGAILNVLANENESLVRGLRWSASSVGGRTHGGITIRGAGQDRTIIKTANRSADLMAAISSGPTIYYPHYHFSGFTLQGPDLGEGGYAVCPFSGRNGSSGNGLRISGTNGSKVTIRDMNAEFFCGLGKAALWLDTAEEFHLDNVELRYSDIGLKLTTDTNASFAGGLKLDSNFSYGGYFEMNTGTTFGNLEVQNNCKNGLFLRLISSMTITSPYFEHNGYCPGGPWHALTLNRVTDSFMTAMNMTGPTDDIYLQGVNSIGGVPPVNSRNLFSIGAPSGFQAGARIILEGTYSAGNVWLNALTSWFGADPTATETLINTVDAFTAGPSSVLTPFVQTNTLRVTGTVYPGPAAGITGSTCTHWTKGVCDHP